MIGTRRILLVFDVEPLLAEPIVAGHCVVHADDPASLSALGLGILRDLVVVVIEKNSGWMLELVAKLGKVVSVNGKFGRAFVFVTDPRQVLKSIFLRKFNESSRSGGGATW